MRGGVAGGQDATGRLGSPTRSRSLCSSVEDHLVLDTLAV
jgi:hypothetical protein